MSSDGHTGGKAGGSVGRRHALRRAREAAGLTIERLAEQVSVDRSTVIRWEHGTHSPQPPLRRRLANVLSLSMAELDQMLLPAVDSFAVEPEFDGRVAQVFSGRHGPDEATADVFRGRMLELDAAYETTPSASLLAEGSRCHASLTLLTHRAANDKQRRVLLDVVAISATLMSQLVWDASGRRDAATALSYCQEAIAAADSTGHVTARANAELRRSYVALYGLHGSRDAGLGLKYAQAAVAASRGRSNALTGLATLHVAEAWAMQGEYRLCERALHNATSMLDQVRPDDPAAGSYTQSQLGRLSGSCYLFLGAPERAEPILKTTARLLEPEKKTRSLVLGNLALSYIRQRKLDEATTTLHEAITAVERTRGAAGLAVVFGAVRELYPWRHQPVVQDVNDRLLGIMAKA